MTVMTDDIDPPDQSDPAEKALALARGAEHEHRVMNSPEGGQASGRRRRCDGCLLAVP
jgi:hypothetical protein